MSVADDEDFLLDPDLSPEDEQPENHPVDVDQFTEEYAAEQVAAQKASEHKAKVDARAAKKARDYRTSLSGAAQRVSSAIASAQAKVVQADKLATTLMSDLQKVDKEVTSLIRQLSLTGSPEDAEASSELLRLKTMCAVNARLASGSLGAYRRMTNLKNFQLIVE